MFELQLERRAVRAKDDCDAVANRRSIDASSVDEQTVGALQIANDPLAAGARDLGVTAADERVRQLDVAAGLATDVEVAGEAEGLPGREADDKCHLVRQC